MFLVVCYLGEFILCNMLDGYTITNNEISIFLTHILTRNDEVLLIGSKFIFLDMWLCICGMAYLIITNQYCLKSNKLSLLMILQQI